MPRVNTPRIDALQRAALEKGLEEGSSHAFRKRCQLILLKSEGRPSEEVGGIIKMCSNSVDSWVKRYKSEGISGLLTKPGRGRKPKLSLEEDGPKVRHSIEKYRQRMLAAKADFEAESGKVVSRHTLRRFLKSLVADTSASENE